MIGYGNFPPSVWLIEVNGNSHVALPLPDFDTDGVACFETQAGAESWGIRPCNSGVHQATLKAVEMDFDQAREVVKLKPDYCKALALLDPEHDLQVLDVCYVK